MLCDVDTTAPRYLDLAREVPQAGRMRVMSTNGASSTASSQTLPLDNAMRLNAQVDSNGVATVDVVENKAEGLAFNGRPRPKAIQLDLSNGVQRRPRCDETSSESASEDYGMSKHQHAPRKPAVSEQKPY